MMHSELRRLAWPATFTITAALVLAACRGSANSPAATTPAPAAATAAATPAPPPVPDEYAPLFRTLSSQLDAWQRTVDGLPQQQGAAPPVFAAHVLAANGNRGPALLDPTTMPVVDRTLDRLKELGVGGVTVSISFPLLNADYPRSADYLAFYETVAQHVRARGLKLSVEQHIVFHGTAFSSVQFDFSALPLERFESQYHDMAQLIIDRVQPDYLTLLSEPDTFVRLTGYRQASTTDGAAAMIDAVIAGLDRKGTKVGAGAGSWLPDAGEYAKAFAASSLDYLSLHVYPVHAQALAGAQGVVDAARAAGKPVVLDEAWLYKVDVQAERTTTFADNERIFLRDVFSFWEPLDAHFLGLVAEFARRNGIAWVAPFWTTFFWGNVEYGDATKGLGYAQLTQQANRVVLQALESGAFTPLGEAYGAAIR